MRADARRNYERLVEVATAVFAEQGTDASLDEIARRAHVGPGTLYRHFPTRYALLEAVFLTRVEALTRLADEMSGSAAPDEALRVWLRAMVTHTSTYRGLGLALMDAAEDDGRAMASCHDTLRAAAQAMLEPAQRAGAVRADLAPMELLRLANAVSLATEKVPDDPAGAADRLLALLMDGLRSRADSAGSASPSPLQEPPAREPPVQENVVSGPRS